MTRKPRIVKWGRSGFTLVELLVVIAIIAILIGILVPAIGAARITAQKTQNSANIRSTLQTFMLYATNNDDRLPIGTVKARLQKMVDPEAEDGMSMAVGILYSPGEKNPFYRKATANNPGGGTGVTSKIFIEYAPTDPNLGVNYSYSLLMSTNPEWPRNNTNSSAVVMSDRLASDGATIPGSTDGSIWNLNKWEGHVGWGDMHMTYEKKRFMSTTHGGSNMSNDDIFKQDSTNDAVLTHPGDSGGGAAADQT